MEIEFHRKQPIQRHDSANRRSGLRKNISAGVRTSVALTLFWDNERDGNDLTFKALKDSAITARYVYLYDATNFYTFNIKITNYEDHIFIIKNNKMIR